MNPDSLNPDSPAREWRLLKTPPAPGTWNMAVDEAILEAAIRGEVLPTLRLYAWKPACLSLGFAQPYTDADLEQLLERGWDLVRRPTGGRAILHVDELTYSVIGRENDPHLSGGIITSYRKLSRALLEALKSLGLPAQSQPESSLKNQGGVSGPVCFEEPSNYEIVVNQKKLVGSAQARRRGGVLQHGTLPLTGDLSRIIQALSFPDEDACQRAAQRLLSRATTVEDALGVAIGWEQAAQAFEEAFTQVLKLNLVESQLSPDEANRAEELVKEKYGNDSWTKRI
jgi:lipoyl(octanoyl) transferase